MTITHKVWNFPTFPISKQLFRVPGFAASGGFTSGGARITSPEPGGFAMLDVQPSWQTGEWEYPLSSWLMSKTNGEILRFRLAPTPQIATAKLVAGLGVPWAAPSPINQSPWSNLQNWSGDLTAAYSAPSLAGSNVLFVDTTAFGPILRPGHVIGHGFQTHLIDEITYAGTVASITVKPPLRQNVATNDPVLFRPYFTGMITNPGDMIATYDAENNGNIQIGQITLAEVVLP